jgi:hypothetical protein
MSQKEFKLWAIVGVLMVAGLAVGSQCDPRQPQDKLPPPVHECWAGPPAGHPKDCK